MSALYFLNQKSFHPNNKANQRKIWIAQQKASENEKKEKERKKQLDEEHQLQGQLNTMNPLERQKTKAQLNFMYQPPPGLMLPTEKKEEKITKTDSNENKFDFLKNAPVEGHYTNDISINHKPFGIEVRDVKCMRCHQWGHTSTEKQCPMFNSNPNDEFRQRTEDPLSLINIASEQKSKVDQELDTDDHDPEKSFLAKLSKKDKKLLLKHLKKLEKKKKHKEKKEKKTKQEK